MTRKMFALMAVALALAPAVAQDTDAAKEKKKMPSSAKYFTSLKAATKEAEKYDAPIFVVAVGKGTPMEQLVKKVMNHKFFKELATKGFFVCTIKVDISKKEKEMDGKTPKVLYDKLPEEERAVLDVIAPPETVAVRRLPLFGMVTPDGKSAKIKPVDMPRPPSPDSDYIGPYLQNLQSAAQAYGIDIDMSKDMRKYIENPPPEKKAKDKKKKR